MHVRQGPGASVVGVLVQRGFEGGTGIVVVRRARHLEGGRQFVSAGQSDIVRDDFVEGEE